MIHEGKLNDDLSRLFFSHFHSPRPDTPLLFRISDDLRNRLSIVLLPDSEFISRCRSHHLHELSFSPDLSIYLSILFICLPLSIYLPSCLSLPFLLFPEKSFYYGFSYRRHLSDVGNTFWRFIKIFSPVSRATANGIRVSQLSIKEVNLKCWSWHDHHTFFFPLHETI